MTDFAIYAQININLGSENGELVIGNTEEEIKLIADGEKIQADGVVLGQDSDGRGTLLVTGNGSTLLVNADSALSLTSDGTGVLGVTGGGKIEMTNYGQILFNGAAVFDNAYLMQSKDTLLDAGSGKIFFDNNSIVNSAGTLNADQGVSIGKNTTLNVVGSNGDLRINGINTLSFDKTATLGITLNAFGDAGKITAENNIALNEAMLLITPEYGNYGAAPLTVEILKSDGTIDGAFANARLSQTRYGALTLEKAIDEKSISLTFAPSENPYANFTQTWNERSVGQTLDAIHHSAIPPTLNSFMQRTWNMSDAELRTLYNDLSGEIRAETMALPLASPGRMAFDHVGWDSQNGHIFFGPQYRLAAAPSRRAVWLRPYYANNKVHSDGNAAGYSLDGYGFVGGFDQTLIGGKTAFGVMLGYGRPELRHPRGKAELDDFLAGAYLASRVWDSLELKVWGGYGYQYYDMTRNVSFDTPQTFRSNFKGNTGTFSAEIVRPIYTGTFLILKPAVGYDYLYLSQKEANETGNSAIGLSFGKTEIARHIGRVGLNAEYGDSARSLYGGAFYKYLLGGDQTYYSRASFLGGGPAFEVRGVDLGKGFVSANLGLQINLSDDRSRMIYIDYNVDFGENRSRYQTATFGFQQTF
ncbi:MAG: autotransporter domain-containing protein [Planctomycetaceae bacterium]|nr:autotransporter domain-containing protein [Planctomycetaceae bacterium]